jgi:uncharacterized protein YjbJ (UPF0337 family)
MNQDQISGKYDQLKGMIKETWGRMTDNDIALYNGQREQFYGRLKEYYGLGRENAEEQMKKMEQASEAA